VAIDLGTGDGRLPFTRARLEPQRLFVGLDANADAMREYSGRALRSRLDNVLFVRAAVEALPWELAGLADQVTVVLPWGSLLAAVARPDVTRLRAIRTLCCPGAVLDVVLAFDPERDRTELARLGLRPLDTSLLVAAHADAGFQITAVRSVAHQDLARWPSTWARRLTHAHPRQVIQLTARARPHELAPGRVDRD
jgi:16S rRNA (adenine(1408)-N(1))-methyltransferase